MNSTNPIIENISVRFIIDEMINKLSMLAYRIVSSFYFDEKNKEKYVSEREVIKSMRIQALFLLFSYNKHNTM